jgi:hypothetical protein
LQIKQDPEIKRTVCYENNSIKANCFFYASNEPKSVLARDLGDCRDNQNWSTGPIVDMQCNEPKSIVFQKYVPWIFFQSAAHAKGMC